MAIWFDTAEYYGRRPGMKHLAENLQQADQAEKEKKRKRTAGGKTISRRRSGSGTRGSNRRASSRWNGTARRTARST